MRKHWYFVYGLGCLAMFCELCFFVLFCELSVIACWLNNKIDLDMLEVVVITSRFNFYRWRTYGGLWKCYCHMILKIVHMFKTYNWTKLQKNKRFKKISSPRQTQSSTCIALKVYEHPKCSNQYPFPSTQYNFDFHLSCTVLQELLHSFRTCTLKDHRTKKLVASKLQLSYFH